MGHFPTNTDMLLEVIIYGDSECYHDLHKAGPFIYHKIDCRRPTADKLPSYVALQRGQDSWVQLPEIQPN
jgi:hypothetical protein